MAFEGNTGLQVATQYGPRYTGNTVGFQTTKTGLNILSLEITSKGLIEGYTGPLVMPKYAKLLRAYITVDRVLTGVTALNVGEGDAPATNGLALVTADLALGTRDVSAKLAGTWATAAAAGTQRAANIRITSTGAPTTDNGLATIVMEFLYDRRVDTEWRPVAATFPTYKAQA